MIFDAIAGLVQNVTGVVNKLVPDKDLASKLNFELQSNMLIEGSKVLQTELTTQRDTILGEENGQSPMQRNWRPILMFTFMVIIVNNYILAPYLRAIWPEVPMMEVPQQMWTLITLSVSGYVVGRSAEKIFDTVKGKA